MKKKYHTVRNSSKIELKKSEKEARSITLMYIYVTAQIPGLVQTLQLKSGGVKLVKYQNALNFVLFTDVLRHL